MIYLPPPGPGNDETHPGIRVGFSVVPGRRFELLKAMPADLQSAPFGRSGNLASTVVRYTLYYDVPTNWQIDWSRHKN